MAKVTMATIKSFIRKNGDNLFVKIKTSFDGMTDGIEEVNSDWKSVKQEDAIGFNGVYCVGHSRDCIREFETDTHKGFAVSNCCGSGIIAIEKEVVETTRIATQQDFKAGNTLIDSEGYTFTIMRNYSPGIWEARGGQGQGDKCVFEGEAHIYRIKL